MKMNKQIQEAETSSETSKADKTYFEEVTKSINKQTKRVQKEDQK